MPFDRNPADHVKADVFSLEALRDWILTQDLATEYDYHDCSGSCLLDSYLLASGIPCTGKTYNKIASVETSGECGCIGADIAAEEPHTYAAALDRCRALIAEGK